MIKVQLKNAIQDINPVMFAPNNLPDGSYTAYDAPLKQGASVEIASIDPVKFFRSGTDYDFSTVFDMGLYTFSLTTTVADTGTPGGEILNKVSIFDGTTTQVVEAKFSDGTKTQTVAAGVVTFTVTIKSYQMPVAIEDDVEFTITADGPIPQGDGANLNDYLGLVDENSASIPLLDVGGEGRIKTTEGIVTGFPMAWNINQKDQKISNGPNSGKDIPNLLAVDSWDNPEFPIPDNSVRYMTMMGVPITAPVVKEMMRTLHDQTGVVLLFDPGDHQKEFEANMQNLELKPGAAVNPPFDEISLTPVVVYGRPGQTDRDEL